MSPPVIVKSASKSVSKSASNGAASNGATSDGELGLAARKILTVLVRRHPNNVTVAHVAILTGYRDGGNFRNAISSLRGAGYIAGKNEVGKEELRATEEGIAACGPIEELPTGSALLRYWQAKLGKAPSLILGVLAAAHPAPLSVEEIIAATGYSDGGNFRNALSCLRTHELISRGDDIVAHESLLD